MGKCGWEGRFNGINFDSMFYGSECHFMKEKASNTKT